MKRTAILKEEMHEVSARIYPQANCLNGELARTIAEVVGREKWKVAELHTEEGRLDEVFRSITLPDTTREAKP